MSDIDSQHLPSREWVQATDNGSDLPDGDYTIQATTAKVLYLLRAEKPTMDLGHGIIQPDMQINISKTAGRKLWLFTPSSGTVVHILD